MEEKIYTLPFDISKLEELKSAGKHISVDMNETHFPENINTIKTVFVYLRNIGFSELIDPEFSKCSYEKKSEYLLEYMKIKNIRVNIQPLIYTWHNILITNGGAPSILTDEEEDKFIADNYEFICEVKRLAMSLPIYAMYRFNHKGLYNLEELEHTDKEPVGENFYNLVSHSITFAMLIVDDKYVVEYKDDKYTRLPPLFYDKYFTVENNALMEMIENLPLMAALNALATSEDNICKQILDEGEKLND